MHRLRQFKNAIGILRGSSSSSGGSNSSIINSKDETEIRALFDSIDTDQSGAIELDEYFLWSLDVARRQGCGFHILFSKYDTEGNGCLDASEFALAIEDLGFSSSFAHDLFVGLDDDNTGSIAYDEVCARIHGPSFPAMQNAATTARP